MIRPPSMSDNAILGVLATGDHSSLTQGDWTRVASMEAQNNSIVAAGGSAIYNYPTSGGGGGASSSGTSSTSSPASSGFDYNAWRAEEDQRLAREQEERRVNNALQSMEGFFQANNLMGLWGGVDKYVRQGYNDYETILGIVSRDKAYQDAYFARFPAVSEIRAINAQRQAQGLPPRAEPTAAAYVALEASYRQALYGLPDGMWGTTDDVAQWIINGVSPQEVEDRVVMAQNYITTDTNQYVRAELRDIYGLTDQEMVAYVLDPDRATATLEAEYERRKKQANVGGGAAAQGVSLDDLLREEIGDTQYGSTFDMSSQVFSGVAAESGAYERLGKLSRQETSQSDLIREAFGISGSADARNKKKKLASQERARFGGQSALSRTSLAQKRAR
jgi:hypothetical protein